MSQATRNINSRRGSVNTEKTEGQNELKCGTCEKPLTKKDKQLKCDLCDLWHHIACLKMDDDTYECILKDRKKAMPLIRTYCTRQCNRAASKYLDGVIILETEVKKLKECVSGVKKSVVEIQSGSFTDEMISTVTDIVTSNISKATPNLEEGRLEILQDEAIGFKSMISTLEREQISEMEDRLSRKSNVFVFGVEEKPIKDRKERFDKDDKKVQEILDKSGVTNKPTKIRCIGNFDKGNKSGRPLRVTFDSEDTSFHKARKEENDSEALLNKVSLRKDLTRKERDEDNALFEKLKLKQKEAKDSGDEYAKWIRRRGRLVNIGRYPMQENEEEEEDKEEEIEEEEEERQVD